MNIKVTAFTESKKFYYYIEFLNEQIFPEQSELWSCEENSRKTLFLEKQNSTEYSVKKMLTLRTL